MPSKKWLKEEIPEADTIYMRVHRNYLFDNEIQPNALFRDHDGAMSTNWSRYCTAEECRQKAKKNPTSNGVLSFIAGAMRRVPSANGTPMVVDHTPLPDERSDDDDRSHTDVIGEKTTEVRLKILDVVTMVLFPADQAELP